MTGGAIIIIFILMVLFIPNGGEREAPFTKFLKYLDKKGLNKAAAARRKALLSTAEDNKENIPFILQMVNTDIQKMNRHFIDMDVREEVDDELIDIDPYSKHLFHGSCHSCYIPYIESISGCHACSKANPESDMRRWEETDYSLEEAEEIRNKRMKDFVLSHKGDEAFILKMVNDRIERDNKRHGWDDTLLTEINPFTQYVFHGGCHSCSAPLSESIAICHACRYYNCWDGYDFPELYPDKD